MINHPYENLLYRLKLLSKAVADLHEELINPDKPIVPIPYHPASHFLHILDAIEGDIQTERLVQMESEHFSTTPEAVRAQDKEKLRLLDAQLEVISTAKSMVRGEIE